MTTFLPAVSLHEKSGVLKDFEICRILPSGDSGSAVKNRDLSTRPRFWATATCGFVGKNRCVLGGFRFFPALPEINGEGDSLEQTNAQTPLNRLVHNIVKSLRPIRNKEKAGAACAK